MYNLGEDEMLLNKLKCFFMKAHYRTIEDDDIDMEKLNNLTDRGAILIDVRSKQEYDEGHLENAISIPEYEIKFKAKEILKNKEQNIIVYCSSGIRSKNAQKKLYNMGYYNVFNLYQGLENY